MSFSSSFKSNYVIAFTRWWKVYQISFPFLLFWSKSPKLTPMSRHHDAVELFVEKIRVTLVESIIGRIMSFHVIFVHYTTDEGATWCVKTCLRLDKQVKFDQFKVIARSTLPPWNWLETDNRLRQLIKQIWRVLVAILSVVAPEEFGVLNSTGTLKNLFVEEFVCAGTPERHNVEPINGCEDIAFLRPRKVLVSACWLLKLSCSAEVLLFKLLNRSWGMV